MAAGRGRRPLPAGAGWPALDLRRPARAREPHRPRAGATTWALVPGNRVLLRAPNNPMLAACWFAVMKAGGIAVATMPLLRAKELATIIDKGRVTHALCDARLADDLRQAAAQTPHAYAHPLFQRPPRPRTSKPRWRANRQRSPTSTPPRTTPCIFAFTSGTTGVPKATMHFHRDVMAICACFPPHVLRARADDVFIGSPPLAFTFGLGGLLLFPMSIGASTVLLERPAPDALRRCDRGLRRDGHVHRADVVSRDGRAQGPSCVRPSCASAYRPAKRCRRPRASCGRTPPASSSSTASARPSCCTSSSRPTRRTRGPAPPAGRCRATWRAWSTTRAARCQPARSAGSP